MSEHNITADRVLLVLSNHIGRDKGISITELAARCDQEFWLEGAPNASERHVRKLIEQLRSQGQHICAHPQTGYYMAATPEELDRTCLFLHERAMTSLRQVAAMKKVSVPDLRGQLNLPT
jgi:hypothetical protein